MKKLSTIIFGLILAFGFTEPAFGAIIQKQCGLLQQETGIWYCYFFAGGTQIGGDNDDYEIYEGEYPDTGEKIFDGGYQSSNIKFGINPTGTSTENWHIFHDAQSSGDDWVYSFQYNGSAWVQDDTEITETRFALITSPETGDTVSSTTPVTFSGYLYINQEDIGDEVLTDDWWVEVRIRRDQDNQIAVANITLLDTVLTATDGSGWVATYNEFSTSTSAFSRPGRYTVSWTLHRESVFASLASFFGLEAYFNAGVLARTQTYFIVDQLTSYDLAVGAYADTIEDAFASTTLETLTERLTTCNPLGNFSMGDCIAGLFTLDPNSSQTLVDQFREMIATRAPVGYVTRLVDILTSETATSSFPVISFTFPSNIGLGGQTLEFDFNETLEEAIDIASTTLVSGNDPQANVWDIIMPVIDSIMYLVLFMAIVHDVTGIHKKQKA